MVKQSREIILFIVLFSFFGCVSVDDSYSYAPHPVITIDRVQAKEMGCVYLFDTDVRETGWSYASATANALRVLKDQALIAEGNAVVIEDTYSTKEYRNGYDVEASRVYVTIYKCPLPEDFYEYDY